MPSSTAIRVTGSKILDLVLLSSVFSVIATTGLSAAHSLPPHNLAPFKMALFCPENSVEPSLRYCRQLLPRNFLLDVIVAFLNNTWPSNGYRFRVTG